MIIVDRELILYLPLDPNHLVNLVSYFIFKRVLGINYIISNIIIWFLSVRAYITNRIGYLKAKADILKKRSLFFGGRIFTGEVDTV